MSINLANAVNWSDPLNRGLLFWGLSLSSDNRKTAVMDLCRGSNLSRGGGADFDGSSFSPSTRGLRCDAAGERAEITTPSHLKIGFPLTLAFWFKPLGSASDGAGLFGVVANNSDSNPYLSYLVGVYLDKFILYWNVGGVFGNETSTYSYSGYSGWHHMVAVFQASSAIYIDGLQITGMGAGPTGTPTYDSTSLTAFGCYTGITGRNANGCLNDGRIYNRALSAVEAQQLYHQSRLGYPTALNRIGPTYGFIAGGGGGAVTVRPRSLLTLGCGC